MFPSNSRQKFGKTRSPFRNFRREYKLNAIRSVKNFHKSNFELETPSMNKTLFKNYMLPRSSPKK